MRTSMRGLGRAVLGWTQPPWGGLALQIFSCLAVEFWEPVYRPAVTKKTLGEVKTVRGKIRCSFLFFQTSTCVLEWAFWPFLFWEQLWYVRIEDLSLFLASSTNLWSSFNQSPSEDKDYATLAQRAKANLLLVLVLFLIRWNKSTFSSLSVLGCRGRHVTAYLLYS